MDTSAERPLNILLTGATGYIGGLLLPRLVDAGHRVRCLVRRPAALADKAHGCAEVIGGDVLDREVLQRALDGVDTAYYLVHALHTKGSYAAEDREAAERFGAAARAAGVGRIVYLGGLGSGENLSEHLASRQEVGQILRRSGVPTVELRASIVIGAGSTSFEMVRALVERLPVMVIPRWVRTPAQPIAVDDVLSYLVSALRIPLEASRVFEIGGADRVSYLGIMREYARQRGLRRLFLPVPVLTPGLSSLWLKLVTPLFARVGRRLIEGVRNPTEAHDEHARRLFGITPLGLTEAVARAMPESSLVKVERREAVLPLSPAAAFAPVENIGGRRGWYFADWLWWLRGLLDRLVGGPGLRRRQRAEVLQPGALVDFWRVEEYAPNRFLRLRAEMKLPGEARLAFEARPEEDRTRLVQIATFDPLGILGRLYWFLLLPVHRLIFWGMLRAIARKAALSAQVPGSERP